MKLKLTGTGFENYTGQMGIVYFENGLSIYDVLPVDALRIAGTIGAVWENGKSANVGEIYMENLHTPAELNPTVRNDPLVNAINGETADEAIAHSNAIAQAQFKAEGIAVPVVTFTTPQPIEKPLESENKFLTEDENNLDEEPRYTREQLEEIADKEGLAGLRKVADPYGVKGNSINTIIERLLKVGA